MSFAPCPDRAAMADADPGYSHDRRPAAGAWPALRHTCRTAGGVGGRTRRRVCHRAPAFAGDAAAGPVHPWRATRRWAERRREAGLAAVRIGQQRAVNGGQRAGEADAGEVDHVARAEAGDVAGDRSATAVLAGSGDRCGGAKIHARADTRDVSRGRFAHAAPCPALDAGAADGQDSAGIGDVDQLQADMDRLLGAADRRAGRGSCAAGSASVTALP